MARLSGVAVAQTAAGFVLLWSGLRNVPIKDTLTGFGKGAVPQGTATGAPALQVGSAGGSGTSGSTGSPAPQAPSGISGNVALGKMMAASYGWGSGSEWNSLYALWKQESGWSATALNPSSGATGIPQLNPNSHAIPAGWSKASVQIAWGLNYIKSTYGDPNAAWAHEQSAGWY